jgi:hypothetical protein
MSGCAGCQGDFKGRVFVHDAGCRLSHAEIMQQQKDRKAIQPASSPPTSSAVECSHCWHSYGSGGGSINADGSGSSWGTNKCCFCGKAETYQHNTPAHTPKGHGPFYMEILTCAR